MKKWRITYYESNSVNPYYATVTAWSKFDAEVTFREDHPFSHITNVDQI